MRSTIARKRRAFTLGIVGLIAGTIAMGFAEGPGVGIATAFLIFGGVCLWGSQ